VLAVISIRAVGHVRRGAAWF